MKIEKRESGGYTIRDDAGNIRSQHADAENMATHYAFLIERHDTAMNLLHRAADHMADWETGPVENWWKEFFQLTGNHMILTEEGWEPGSAKAEHLKDDPDWRPRDEVCAPTVIQCEDEPC